MCRMGRAKRNPSDPPANAMGFAALYPSYETYVIADITPRSRGAIRARAVAVTSRL